MIIRDYIRFLMRVVFDIDFQTVLGMDGKALILCAFRIYTESQDDEGKNGHSQAMSEKANEWTIVRGCAI